jgi:hypothetical protein
LSRGTRYAVTAIAIAVMSNWAVTGCVSNGPRHRTATNVDTGDGSRVPAADSLEIIEDLLAGAGPGADVAAAIEAGEIAGEISAEIADAVPSRRRADQARPAGGRPFVRVEGLTGYRMSVRGDGGWRGPERSARIGFRRYSGRRGEFAEIRGVGPLKRLVVGGLRPRLGEGVLLGARYSPFTPTSGAPVREGLSATPTSTVWDPKRGAVAEVALGAFSLSLAGWLEGDADEMGEKVYWASVSRSIDSWLVGLAAGRRAPDGGYTTTTGLDTSIFAGCSLPDATIAGEVTRFRGRVYAALRAVFHAEATWKVEAYNGPVPSGFSNSAVAPGDVARQRWGGALHRMGRIGNTSVRLSVYANVRRTALSLTRRRRLETTASGRTGSLGRWEASVRLSQDAETAHSREVLDYNSEASRQRRARVRLGWNATGPGLVRQRYRVSLHLDGNDGFGALTTIGWSFVGRWADADFSVNNYSISPGQLGYAVRPGIAGYEIVSAVSHTGSDLSARFRIRWRGLRLCVYWGQPWQRPPRHYASVGLSL